MGLKPLVLDAREMIAMTPDLDTFRENVSDCVGKILAAVDALHESVDIARQTPHGLLASEGPGPQEDVWVVHELPGVRFGFREALCNQTGDGQAGNLMRRWTRPIVAV